MARSRHDDQMRQKLARSRHIDRFADADERKAYNQRRGLEFLAACEVPFRVSGDFHVIIEPFNGLPGVDYWPRTGLFHVRDRCPHNHKRKGRGIFVLLKLLGIPPDVAKTRMDDLDRNTEGQR